MIEDERSVHLLRKGLFALAALGLIGTVAELASLRHWVSASQIVPWIVVAIAGMALAAAVVHPNRMTVNVAFAVGLILAVTGLYGVIVHIISNYQAAPLDGAVGPTWDSMTLMHKVWLASTGGVGPAPPLAAASLAPTGLALALATFRHPKLVESAPPGALVIAQDESSLDRIVP